MDYRLWITEVNYDDKLRIMNYRLWIYGSGLWIIDILDSQFIFIKLISKFEMKPTKFSAGFMAAAFMFFLRFGATAQKATDWEHLFNGKDMTGWKELNGKHKWEVRDSMIVGTTVQGQPNGFLCTEKVFGDFILEYEAWIDTLMNNSGVQFRSLSYPAYQNNRVHGYQLDFDPNPPQWSGSIYDEARRGWLYVMGLNPGGKNAMKNNQWNKFRLECIGTTIRAWVNGIPTAHLIDEETAKGFIGLQLHTNNAPGDAPGSQEVRFRNIRVQTNNLKPSPLDNIFVVNLIPNNLSAQEKKNGYSLLWDGKTTRGWRAANNSRFPESGWRISDGALNVVSPAGTGVDIVTEKKYDAFELKFDFKFTAGGNGGVKYFVNESKNDPGATAASLEYQIVDNENSGITLNRTLGSLADVQEPEGVSGAIKKPGEWNQGVIRVFSDNRVEYWLNGNKILDYRRGSPEFKEAVSKSKYKDLPNFGMAARGHILLEGRESAVSYRSIKIKELR